ncbi:MAG TPA: hypothetical protein VH834_02030 [Solirubrobacteraceae bacterium]|jgi:hypothetical protein
MIYLVVGLDRRTLAGWHHNVQAADACSAAQGALRRAAERGIDLIVAAVIGAGSNVLFVPAAERQPAASAA